MRFDRERMREAASDELIAATDVADLLVRLRRAVPRGARGRGGPRAHRARQRPRALAADRRGARRAERAARRARGRARARCSAQSSWLESKVSEGGTSLARVREQLERRGCWREVARCERSARRFYARPVLEVARELIGCVVEHAGARGRDRRDRGLPRAASPPAMPSSGSRRARETLFGAPGRAYVYRSYGVHALLNAVCEPAGRRRGRADPRAAAARGIDAMHSAAACSARGAMPRGARGCGRATRAARDEDLCSGPGKLTQALGSSSRRTAARCRAGPS